MEAKKNKRADLEKRSKLFLQLGLVVSVAVILMAFEWSKFENGPRLTAKADGGVEIDEIEIQVTKHDVPQIKKLPPIVFTKFEIVDDGFEDILDIEIPTGDDPIFKDWVYTLPPEKEDYEAPLGYEAVEIKPKFPGGEQGMFQYLAENLVYPTEAVEAGIEGTVYISFVIDKQGNVTRVKIENELTGGCSEEAFRVVKEMPKWSPGRQQTRKVEVSYVIPITFALQ